MTREQLLRILVIGFIIISIIAIVAALAVTFVTRIGKVELNIVVAPSDSTITLDGEQISAGKIYVTSGDHTLVASHQYFTDDTYAFNTNDIDTSQTIYLLPTPTDEGMNWLLENTNAQLEREAAAGAQNAIEQEALTKSYPIVSKLPYKTTDYRIDYGFNQDGTIFFKITLTPPNAVAEGTDFYYQTLREYKTAALNFLTKNGVNTSTVQITFTPDPDQ